MSDMGILRTTVLIENPLRRGDVRSMPETLVDTGAELTWAPRALMEDLGIAPEKRETFQMADGRVITRDVGYAIVHTSGARTNDEVVFAEEGDLVILGARSLEGMNLRIDPRNKQLVAAGPIVAAHAVMAGAMSAPRRDARRLLVSGSRDRSSCHRRAARPH